MIPTKNVEYQSGYVVGPVPDVRMFTRTSIATESISAGAEKFVTDIKVSHKDFLKFYIREFHEDMRYRDHEYIVNDDSFKAVPGDFITSISVGSDKKKHTVYYYNYTKNFEHTNMDSVEKIGGKFYFKQSYVIAFILSYLPPFIIDSRSSETIYKLWYYIFHVPFMFINNPLKILFGENIGWFIAVAIFPFIFSFFWLLFRYPIVSKRRNQIHNEVKKLRNEVDKIATKKGFSNIPAYTSNIYVNCKQY